MPVLADPNYVLSALGGGLIGIAVTLMLLFNGRVTGVSSILSEGVLRHSQDNLWRWLFLAGLLVGGVLTRMTHPELLENATDRKFETMVVAGLFVGFGTAMAGGCTSGHGVCGVSRFSPRSLVATLVFILVGVLTVTIFNLMSFR